MTRQEILEYNKLCAEFLGAKLGKGGSLKNPCYTGVPINHNGVIQKWTLVLKDMRFHSDWNWIMEVIEVIKNLKETKGQGIGTLMVTKFEMTNSSVTISFENGDFYDTIHVYHTDNGKYFKHEGDVNTLKEAVVQAINQFLIWNKNQSVNSVS